MRISSYLFTTCKRVNKNIQLANKILIGWEKLWYVDHIKLNPIKRSNTKLYHTSSYYRTNMSL